MKFSPAKFLNVVFASGTFTAALLAYTVVFLLVASLAQAGVAGLSGVGKYAESFFFLADFGSVKIPLAGGAAIAVAAVLNMVFGAFKYSEFGVAGFGRSLTSMSVALLVVSCVLQYFMRSEGYVMLSPRTDTAVAVIAPDASFALPFKIELRNADARGCEVRFLPKGGGSVGAELVPRKSASFGGWTFFLRECGDGGCVLKAVKNPARFLPFLACCGIFAGMLIMFAPVRWKGGNA